VTQGPLRPPSFLRKLYRKYVFSSLSAFTAAVISFGTLSAGQQSTPMPSESQGAKSTKRIHSRGLQNGSAGPLNSGPIIFLPPQGHYDDGDTFPAVAVADINGDGKLDLIVSDNVGVGVFFGNGDGTFQPVKNDVGPLQGVAIAVADVNDDGNLDVLLADGCQVSCEKRGVVVLLGNGDGTFKPGRYFTSGGYFSYAIAIADVNGDGKLDVVVSNQCPDSNCSANGTIAVLLGRGNGTFEPPVIYDSGGNPGAVVIADVNRDGEPDIVLSNTCSNLIGPPVCTANSLGVLLGNGDGTFQKVRTFPAGGYMTNSIAVADFNGDGKLDIVAANLCSSLASCNGLGGSVDILLGNGNGTFQKAVPIDTVEQQPAAIFAADVNGDGKLDLVAAGCGDCLFLNGVVTVLLGNGDGTFQRTSYPVNRLIGAFAVADVNRDSKPDLVLTQSCPSTQCGGESLKVMLNNNGTPATATSIVSSKNPVVNGPLTFRASVAAESSEALGGTVTFADAYQNFATVKLVDNQASFTAKNEKTVLNSVGNNPITATYSGVFHTAEGSRSATLLEDAKLATDTKLATSGSPSDLAQPVGFTATMISNSAVPPDGELVKFYDGTTFLGSASLTNGQATFTTSKLSAQTHRIRATYVGDLDFASSSGYVTQVVDH
jgi:uncharacterized protein (DUF2141 family)